MSFTLILASSILILLALAFVPFFAEPHQRHHPKVALALASDHPSETLHRDSSLHREATPSDAPPHEHITFELKIGNPAFIDQYCDRIINGTAPTETLIFALPGLLETLRHESYPSADRIHIRDSLKKVIFHGSLSDHSREEIFNAICDISEM